MAAPAAVNGDLSQKPAPSTPQNTGPNAAPRPPRKKFQKPNYAKIHAKPLPLETFPLPAFIPQSPLSLIRIAAAILQQFLSRPKSHPTTPYVGYFSSESRSVHVTDPTHVRALWEMGFFGKGTLSRSEPSWLGREKARLKAGGAGSAEEATRKRREERRMFKLERARAEREQIEQQLKQEKEASARTEEVDHEKNVETEEKGQSNLAHVFPWRQEDIVKDVPTINDVLANDETTNAATIDTRVPQEADETVKPSNVEQPTTMKEVEQQDAPFVPEEPVVEVNQEHLQLTLEEAFFLAYGLGVLEIKETPAAEPIKTTDLFTLSRRHSVFPPATNMSQLCPDDSFLLNYAVYHYYRSLGWVVRPGVKFSADYMLYNRGPVFSHAEFAVIIIPEYAQDAPEDEKKESRDWWWLHCVNRVQSQVRKSLVICYVEVPTAAALRAVGEGDIGAILRQYKVREFVIRRFLANRSRD